MAEKAKGGFDLLHLFIKPDEEEGESAEASVAPVTEARPTTSSVAPGGSLHVTPATVASPASQVPAIVEAIRQKFAETAPTNSVLVLANVEATMADAIADPTVRRKTALASLGAMKITEATLAQDAKKVGAFIDDYLATLSAQAEQGEQERVTDARAKAQDLRTQSDGFKQQIAELEEKSAAALAEAGSIEQKADAAAAKITAFRADLEAAKPAAYAAFNVTSKP